MSDGYFNPCLMLSLLYHKHNALIATAADGEEDTFPQVLNDKIIICIKTPFLYE